MILTKQNKKIRSNIIKNLKMKNFDLQNLIKYF